MVAIQVATHPALALATMNRPCNDHRHKTIHNLLIPVRILKLMRFHISFYTAFFLFIVIYHPLFKTYFVHNMCALKGDILFVALTNFSPIHGQHNYTHNKHHVHAHIWDFF